MKKLLDSFIEKNKEAVKSGNVATYIPELAKADANDLGICVVTLKGEVYKSGLADKKFTIQSISKVISLMLAILDNGKDNVFERVGVEPTGDSFNSIVNLEIRHSDRPYNPMVNSGAIVTTSLIEGESKEEKFERILEFTKKVTGNDDITVTEDLAKFGAMLANEGVLPWSGERVISRDVCRIVKTIMVTCGMYDDSGKFAVHIGIPAKSGVGGGIMASVPRRMGIGVYGPALDEKGNSIGGKNILRDLSEEMDLSIF
ncbi:MAG: glutaminase [Sarcina sp.]